MIILHRLLFYFCSTGLSTVTTKAFNQILNDKDGFLRQMQENIAKAITTADTMSPDGIQARLDKLQKEQSELDSHRREEVMNRIKELQDFIAGQETDITEFDEALVKKLIEKITVFADHFTVEFKSGLTIDIEA